MQAEEFGAAHLRIVPFTEAEATRIARETAPATDFAAPEPFEARPGGAAARAGATGPQTFEFPSANMDEARKLDFVAGESLFDTLWVAAPSGTTASDGLRPLSNARVCANCHPENGRGHRPDGPQGNRLSMVLRISVPDAASASRAAALERLPNAPHPSYGLQVQDRAFPGIAAEGQFGIACTPVSVTLGDGTVVALRKPTYAFDGGRYGAPHQHAPFTTRPAWGAWG